MSKDKRVFHFPKTFVALAIVWFFGSGLSFILIGLLLVNGYGFVQSDGISMEPTFSDKCFHLAKNIDWSNGGRLEIGDVSVRERIGVDWLHRIVGKCESGYIHRGDANSYDDGCFPFSHYTHKIIFSLCLDSDNGISVRVEK